MRQKRLLDLFCGPGGACRGYQLAGFEVTGVDTVPQPRYPGTFVLGDALTFPLNGYDAIHASPNCQRFSHLNRVWKRDYPDYIAAIRERLIASGMPFVMENVPGAPLSNALMLCGSMFGLRVLRHRLFESNVMLFAPGRCQHQNYMAFGHCTKSNESDYRDAMECHWMRAREARQAIPPAYTRWLGHQLHSVM